MFMTAQAAVDKTATRSLSRPAICAVLKALAWAGLSNATWAVVKAFNCAGNNCPTWLEDMVVN